MFKKSSNAFGLEIGNAAIKVLELQKIGKKYKIKGYRREKLPPGAVVDNEIQNEIKVIETIKKAMKKASPRPIKSRNVIVALPENKTYIKIFQIPKLNKEEQDKLVALEIEKYIPMSISEVHFDWQIINAAAQNLIIFLAAAPKKTVESYQNTLIKAGLSPQVFDLEATAEARALISEKAKKPGASMICDIGETKTLLIVYENNNIPFTKTLTSIAGSIFTQKVCKALNVKESDAEKKKITCCSPKMKEEERKTLQALHSVLDSLAFEIEKILTYCQDHFKEAGEINEILLCGGGAATVGMAKYLALKLRKKVKIGNPWINIPLVGSLPMDINESLSFAKTIGLAMRGSNL